jgi:hypothetical protein
MFRALIGAGATGGRRGLAGFVDRSDLWAGPAALGDEAAADPGAIGAGGIVAATLIATERGWARASDLRPGDRIVTFDSGLQTLRALGRGRLASAPRLPHRARPLAVPAGALGNRRPLTLLPGQSVLIESDKAEELYGDPFALVPADALEGWRGIARIDPEAEIEVRFLEFDGDEIVYAEGMALVHCPRHRPIRVGTVEELIAAGAGGAHLALPAAQGRALIAAMAA